jgi:hypothetical protein
MTMTSIHPVRQHSKEDDPSRPRLQKGCVFHVILDGEISTSQRRGATPHERHKSDKELPSLAFLFFLSL